MTGKYYAWHKAWHRQGARLVHDSGLSVEFDEVLGWHTCDDTLEAWGAFELARGVPLHDQLARLQRLLKEAALWQS